MKPARRKKTATLADLLHAAGVSQVDLCRALQVDASYVSHIVHGRKQPSLRRATRMALALGVTLDQFQEAVVATAATARGKAA